MRLIIPFLATLGKELRLLKRDPAGLLILFFMPAALVLIITLVQNNIMAKIGDCATDLLLVDRDHGPYAEKIINRLRRTEGLRVILRHNEEKVRREVRQGRFQVALFIAPGLSEIINQGSGSVITTMTSNEHSANKENNGPAQLSLLFNPTAIGAFRANLVTTMNLLALSLEYESTLRAIAAMTGEDIADVSPPRFILVEEEAQSRRILPTAVQQNVPAWTIFGIFFIVVPLSASLLQERNSGTLARLRIMPAPLAILLLGKFSAYGLVCLGQCLLIGAIGAFLLPLFGLPSFDFGVNGPALSLMLTATIAAAASFGIALGTMSKTHDQAAMAGAISVVMAAAIGGVMAPVHAMPLAMQKVSVISPLGWALDGMLTIFVRHGTIQGIVAKASLLFAFTLVNIMLAWFAFSRQQRNM